MMTFLCYAFLVTPDDIIQQHFARFDEKFFHYCDKELLKINTFFSGNTECLLAWLLCGLWNVAQC